MRDTCSLAWHHSRSLEGNAWHYQDCAGVAVVWLRRISQRAVLCCSHTKAAMAGTQEHMQNRDITIEFCRHRPGKALIGLSVGNRRRQAYRANWESGEMGKTNLPCYALASADGPRTSGVGNAASSLLCHAQRGSSHRKLDVQAFAHDC